ncbi:hypothetical protein [Pseudomonas benzenivorans]|uniref:Oxidoreductase n=1 Tax=Pseudomonas benzenivorans TaxID=556533 RepID=A0ABY5H4F6_9PSED|nr:hypothetical protein [Pseudomonas benzenivorans]UTW07186.1 hypothetical protein KDW96_18765 [Pseudomonas benzenivorans]
MPSFSSHDDWYAGLKALCLDDFPKHCRNCGRTFASEDEYFRETRSIRPEITGLKGVDDPDDGPLVEVFRNCVCGSTLLVSCCSRRDDSDAGHRRRELFDKLLNFLELQGLPREQARGELLRLMSGERSPMLETHYGQLAAQARKLGG